MSRRFKMGLTRNRLFEFCNCVCFAGETEIIFDAERCEKALGTLCLKEPLLSCGIEFDKEAHAYFVTEKYTPSFEFYNGDSSAYIRSKMEEGFDFSQQLFSFSVLNGNVLGIFAHTAVADVRSLMYIAKEFMAIYKSEILSVVPSEPKVISEVSQLPSNVFSVVIDRLASDLEMSWQENSEVFTYEDYREAGCKYLSDEKDSGILVWDLDENVLGGLHRFAESEKIDVSSVVAFAFYDSLTNSLGGKRKFRKLNVQADERIFFEDFHKMEIGAYNGLVCVEKKRDKKTPDTFKDNAVSFHKEIYKRVTSAFKVFYNEFLFMRLPESFVDSQYMYCAGVFEKKCSKKLAEIYGCANTVAGEFCAYNLNQDVWSGLSPFKNIFLQEPLKMRAATMLTFIERGVSAKLCFAYRKDRVSDSLAQSVLQTTFRVLKECAQQAPLWK